MQLELIRSHISQEGSVTVVLCSWLGHRSGIIIHYIKSGIIHHVCCAINKLLIMS